MASFDYEVVDREGKLRRGQMEAAQEEILHISLSQQGFFVLNIRRSGAGVATVTLPGLEERRPIRMVSADALKRLLYRLKVTDLILFSGQLAAMIESGLHLVRSLRALAGETLNKRLRGVIDQVASDVEAGSSLAGALERHPWAFDKVFVSLIRVGEAASQLPAVLNQLTVYLEKSAYMRRKIIGALAYPLVILSITVVIFFIVVLQIVPIFENIYNRLNAPLPTPTLTLIWVSQVIRAHFLAAIVGLALIAIVFHFGIPAERARYTFDRFKLRLPIFGRLIRKASLAKVCRTLSLLIQGGVPLLEALDMSAEAAGNRVIADAMRQSLMMVREGGAVAEALRRSGQFPSLVTQMVATGEESGQLAAMLGKSALYYEQQVDAAVNALTPLLEPVLIVIVGIIAGAIIISLYLPIFGLGQAILGGARRF